MSADPLSRLLPAFADVLARHRAKRNWSVDAFATAVGISPIEIRSMERGDYGPSLLEFFRIAEALNEKPALLLTELIEVWRADPMETRRQSRASDFARLFRLGYHHKPGDFRELLTPYFSVAEATHAAGMFNAHRHSRGVALLDTVTVYVRLDSVSLRPEVTQEVP